MVRKNLSIRPRPRGLLGIENTSRILRVGGDLFYFLKDYRQVLVLSSVATMRCPHLRRHQFIKWLDQIGRSATSPHQTDCVALEISNPRRWKMSFRRYNGRYSANLVVTM
jgi:hypothetical protein